MQWNKIISFAISGLLVMQLLPRVSVAQQTIESDSDKEIEGPAESMDQQEMLTRFGSIVSAIRNELDRTAFDFDALLDQLDYDSERIIEFSKVSIAFEQYPGVLRGPLGVLFSRAGNSIDQSLFLAKLLRDGGYEARIVGAEISLEQASEVLRSMKQVVTPPPPIGDAKALLQVFRDHNIFGTDVPQDLETAYIDYVNSIPLAQDSLAYDKVQKVSAFLLEQMSSGGVDINGKNIDAEIVREARQYFWVQYKDSASGPWTNVHPVFQNGLPFEEPEPEEFFASAVPERLQHRLRFQVFIERKVGDQLEVVPITSVWEAPVANLVGTSLTFANFSDSMLGGEKMLLDLENSLNSANSFVPTFGGELAPGAKFFDLRGNIVDPMAASNPAAGIFSEVNRAFGDAIGSIESQNAIPTLTAQWMEFVIVQPGGAESTYRRTTFDRIGPAARRSNTVPKDLAPSTNNDVRTLIQRHTFAVNVGRMPRGFAIQSAAEHFDQWMPGIKRALEHAPGERNSGAGGGTPDVPPNWGGIWALFSNFDQADTIGSNHRNYRSAPALLIYSDGLGGEHKHIERVDIVSNPRRVLAIDGDTPSFDPRLMVQAGVWETIMEGAFFDTDEVLSTSVVFDAARNMGTKPMLVIPGELASKIVASPNTIASIESDLQRGFSVIAPSVEPSSGQAGWWRVDTETGETLGQILDGRGAVATEKIILLTISAIFMGISMSGCVESQKKRNQSRFHTQFWDTQGACCLIANGGISWLAYLTGITLLTGWKVSTQLAFTTTVAMDVGGWGLPIDEACGAVLGD